MNKNKKKRRNTRRKNQPIKRQQATKTIGESEKKVNSPIPQSLLNTVSDSTVQDSIEILNLLNELNFGKGRSTQENSDMMYRIYNVPGPRLWRSRFLNAAIEKLPANTNDRLSDKREREIREKLLALITQKPKAFDLLGSLNNGLFWNDADMMYNNMTDEELERGMKFIPLNTENVTFYHGTSYENYLQIKESGVIRHTDYTDFVNERSANREKHFRGNSGYVFLSDSIDKPLSYSFGGYRDTLLDYGEDSAKKSAKAHLFKQKGEKLRKENIGVIFEFQPKGYNVFYAVAESDFVVDSDIQFTDIGNVRFFYIDNDVQIQEITEQEIEERGIE